MEKSFESKIKKMDAKLGELQNRIAAVKPPSVVSKETPKETVQPVKKRTHLVRTGETLYGISHRYGVSIDKLRTLNKLDKKADIYPGQKLKIN